MRYLPTLEVRDKMIQVALPDIHGVALAEAALLSGEAQREKLLSILLDSPMLLFWGIEKFNTELVSQATHASHFGLVAQTTSRSEALGSVSAGPGSPVGSSVIESTQSEFVENLLALIASHSRELVQDHATNLTSIERIEVDRFVDFHAFFEIKQPAIDDRSHGLAARAVLMSHLFAIGLQFRLRTDGKSQYIDGAPLLREFQRSDFSKFDRRNSILVTWEQEITYFRNGLSELDQRLERVEKLERDFEAEVEKAKLAAMRQLAYGASHEVNNPLANISTRAQALLRDETDPKRRQRLQTIDAQAFRAHDMISNLMTFARPPRPEFARFQLLPVVEKAAASLRSTADSQHTEIEIEVDAAIYFEADPNQVKEMIFALVQNSLEAIRQNGKVRIKAKIPENNQAVAIEVIDDGPGISPEVRQHIFDPFFSGREAGRGLGFGLSKVWRLMELHQGKVEIADLDGLTCIRLRFPSGSTENSELGIGKTA